MKKAFYLFLFCLFIYGIPSAQAQTDDDLLQLSGVVVSTDSLQGLPFVSVRIKGLNKGTFTDADGFFSFVVRKGDTVLFTFIGMKDAIYVVPKNLTASRYSIVQPMAEDSVLLPETVIHAWPTPEEFNYYFVKANIPDTYGTLARNNLKRKTLTTFGSSMIMDARENQRYAADQTANRYYYSGQLPPQRLFDPFAWSQFFNAWKRGDFKKK
jgi:hypothetical protein